jgi:SAM-dependent methyltransferase
MQDTRSILNREVAYHERLYAGFAQRHFARPAVRALREHMVGRILRVTGVTRDARVLSLGCGIGDTELLLATQVAELVGIDLAPSAIRQAREDAAKAGVQNVQFIEGTLDAAALDTRPFDLVIAIFFLHHLPESTLKGLPGQIARLLRPGGMFYSLDPSRYRLSGAIGSLLIPWLMRRYQSPDEQQLDPKHTVDLFRRARFDSQSDYYDFLSSPLAGLFPGFRSGYRAARVFDDGILRIPLVRRLGSNFEIIARKSLEPSSARHRVG